MRTGIRRGLKGYHAFIHSSYISSSQPNSIISLLSVPPFETRSRHDTKPTLRKIAGYRSNENANK